MRDISLIRLFPIPMRGNESSLRPYILVTCHRSHRSVLIFWFAAPIYPRD